MRIGTSFPGRGGRRTYISMGPLGWALIGPILFFGMAAVWMILGLGWLLYQAVRLLFLLGQVVTRAIAARRHGQVRGNVVQRLGLTPPRQGGLLAPPAILAPPQQQQQQQQQRSVTGFEPPSRF